MATKKPGQLIKFENERQAEFVKAQTESEETASNETLTPSLVVVKDSHFEPTLKQLQNTHDDFIYDAVGNADINDLLKKCRLANACLR